MSNEDRAKQRIHDIANLFVNGTPKPTLCWANTAVYYIAGEFDIYPTVAQGWFSEAFAVLAARRKV